ncbi:hypothetical protein MUK42_08056 [Musa troglodytarum]|uniref:Uncharacterized protein n=1 Tax=Musa troglodytarum TaxID=320322 RepID=A0A9E7KLI0_9LILI|nr:hypothetical protein MUK42_08056 [Musa troglodytarum]
MVVYAAAAAAAGHPDEWVHDAFSDPRLAATVLLSFRRGSRPEPESEGDEKPSTSSAAADAPLPEWGRRIKRPRMMRLPRILSATRDEEMEDEAAEKRKGKRRASPQSPLEGYSSASASDGEERASSAEKPPKAPMSPFPASPSGDGRTKVVADLRAPPISSVPVSAPIRRPASRKMTKPELQAVERALLEERANLHKDMEVLRRAVEELRADNRKLEMHLELSKLPITVHMALEDVRLHGSCQPTVLSSSSPPGRRDFIAIPDLNDPLPDC